MSDPSAPERAARRAGRRARGPAPRDRHAAARRRPGRCSATGRGEPATAAGPRAGAARRPAGPAAGQDGRTPRRGAVHPLDAGRHRLHRRLRRPRGGLGRRGAALQPGPRPVDVGGVPGPRGRGRDLGPAHHAGRGAHRAAAPAGLAPEEPGGVQGDLRRGRGRQPVREAAAAAAHADRGDRAARGRPDRAAARHGPAARHDAAAHRLAQGPAAAHASGPTRRSRRANSAPPAA